MDPSTAAIDEYLETLSHQIYTENNANLVSTELRDHIESLRSLYIELGYTEEEAVQRALNQMGSPREIGMAFNQPEIAYKQMFKLHLYKGLSFAILFCWLLFLFYTSIELGQWDHPLSGFQWPSLNGFLKNSSSFSSLYNMIYLLMIGGFMNQRFAGKKSWLDFELRPLMILWPVTKKRKLDLVWTTVAIMYGGPVLAVFFLPAYAEGFKANLLLGEILFIVSILGSWFLYRLAEKQRLPKAIVAEEGLIIKDKFISWTAIDKVSWSKHFANKNEYYSFQLRNQRNFPLSGSVEVSVSQRAFLSSLFSRHLEMRKINV